MALGIFLNLGAGAAQAQTLISSDTTFGPADTLTANLQGTIPVTDYDQVLVDGATLTLGGTLEINLIGGFAPSVLDRFDLITTTNGGVLGNRFDALRLPILGGAETWLYTQDGSETAVEAVAHAAGLSFSNTNLVIDATHGPGTADVMASGGSGFRVDADSTLTGRVDSADSLLINTNGNNLVLTGPVFVTDSLTKTGLGTLTLNGPFTIGDDLFINEGDLLIQDLAGGASLTVSGDVLFGDLAGTTGTGTVSGPGTTWNINDDLFIGDDGTGTLNVTDGASVVIADDLFSADGGAGTLNITSGASVTVNDQATLGDDSGSTGTGNISGVGSTWNINDDLLIGDGGTGTLNITSGASVTVSDEATLGDNSGSTGTGNVSGPGSTWNINDDLFVGDGGTGTLNITSGAAVTVGDDATLGDNSGSTGTGNVSGAGTTWDISDDLLIADGGTGTLDIFNRGSVTVGRDAIFGDNTGSNGAGTVSGTGTIWDINDDLFIGDAGTGTLDVSDSASVDVTDFLIVGISGTGALNITSGASVTVGDTVTFSDLAGSTGTGNISGPGTTLNINNDLFIGFNDTGTLDVSDGASVGVTDFLIVGSSGTGVLDITSGASVTVGNTVTFSDLSGSTGTGNISGTGTTWDINNDLFVGFNGTSTLDITGGAAVTVGDDATLGNNSGSAGTGNVSGAGTTWDISDILAIGNNGTGTLNVSGSASVTVGGNALIGDNPGSIGIGNISGPGTLLSVANNLLAGDDGTGTLNVSDSASVNAANLLIVGDEGTGTLDITSGAAVTVGSDAILGDNTGSTGTGTVSGPGTTLDINNDLFVGNNGTSTLDLTGGAAVTVGNETRISEQAGAAGSVTVDGAGSRLDTAGALLVGLGDNGTLTVSNGAAVSANTAVLNGAGGAATGTLNLDGGTFTTNNGLDHRGVISGHGTINGPVAHDVLATITGGVGADVLIFNGAVVGGGDFGGNIRFNGSYSPGNSPAQTTFTGDTVFGPANTLIIELGGTTPGTEHDQVVVDGGSLALDGRLDVDLIDDITPSYTPALGDQFDVITTASGGSVTGAFDNVLLPFIAAGLGWDTATTPGGVSLTVVSFMFGDLAQTPNQQAVAAALDTIAVSPTPEQQALLSQLLTLDTAQGQNVLDQISGQLHSTLSSVSLQSTRQNYRLLSRQLRPAVRWNPTTPAVPVPVPETLDLLPSAYAYRATGLDEIPGGLGLDDETPTAPPGAASTLHAWALGYGVNSDVEDTDNAAGLARTAGGTLFGVEETGDRGTRVGLYAGVGFTQVELAGNAQESDIDQYQLGAYLAHDEQPCYYIVSGSVGLDQYQSTRPTGLGSVASADYTGVQASAYLERGIKLDRGAWQLRPYAALNYIYHYQNDFTERGAGPLNLDVDSANEHSLQSVLGIQIGRPLSGPAASTLGFEVRALWAHEFLETDRPVNASLGVGGPRFRSLGNDLGRDSGVLGTSLSFAVTETADLVISYDAQFSEDQVSHSGSLGLRWEW